MARLTERELDLIRHARQLSWRRVGEAAPLVQVLNAARAAQAEVLGSALARGFKLLARYTGLNDLAYLVKAGAIDPLRRGACYRRTLAERRHLDTHRLHDIGMTRGDVERFAWQAALEQVPASKSRPWLATWLRAYFRRQSLVRELTALEDRSLADVGIERGDIGAIVDRMVAKEFPELQAAAPAPAKAAVRKRPTPPSPALDALGQVVAKPTTFDLFKQAKTRYAA